jgi:putative ABC transport system permease protein
MGGQGQIGVYTLELSDPSRAVEISNAIDSQFDSSAPATRTESEQAFQAGFVSMYGNLPFVLRILGLAIVFSILLIAANTMMTAVRERTSEFGVLKTLGFTDRAVFTMVVIEAAVITLGGGAIGALLAKLAVEGSGFNAMGFLPPMSVYWSTVAVGIGMSVVIGAVSGLVPAFQVSRRRIVDALRRVD